MKLQCPKWLEFSNCIVILMEIVASHLWFKQAPKVGTQMQNRTTVSPPKVSVTKVEALKVSALKICKTKV